MARTPLPRVGISSCLLGERVRYDGGHRRQSDLLEAFEGQVEWVPNCPEVELGLGVPRETIQIESHSGALKLMTHESRRDLTEEMTAWAVQRANRLAAQRICGYIFKARSPSCGVGSVSVAGLEEKTFGIFAQEVARSLPLLPLVEEEDLTTNSEQKGFLKRVRECFHAYW